MNKFDDRLKTAFVNAQDLTKQLITLSTAIVTLGITFYKDFAKDASVDARTAMASSWILFFASVVLGLFALMAMIGELEDPEDRRANLLSKPIVAPAIMQVVLFFVALGVAVYAGWRSIPGLPPPSS